MKSISTASDVFARLNPFAGHRNKDQKKGMYEYIPSCISAGEIKKAVTKFKKLHGRKAETFLDLGCGKGGAMYAALDAGLTPSGVEISKELIHLAKEIQGLGLVKGSEKLTFIQGDILKWVPDKEYDIVYFYHPLSDSKLHEQFVSHVYKSFPIGQLFFIIGGKANHKGFEYLKSTGCDYLFTSVEYKPGNPDCINNLKVVASIDGSYIVQENFLPSIGRKPGRLFYKIPVKSVKMDDSLRFSSNKVTPVNFKLL
jgi:SAM-dependent methyltransferase